MTLVPQNRYARMPNVWFLPSCDTMIEWLRKPVFKNIRLLNVSTTTVEEQRTTEWMTFESLSEALDKNDPSTTIRATRPPCGLFLPLKSPDRSHFAGNCQALWHCLNHR